MKRFKVRIISAVEDAIRGAFYYIHERSPQNAAAWLRGLYQAIETLETMPARCSLIREQAAFDEEVRELLHHAHRIIFTIHDDDALVLVHAFRHSAQDDLQPPED